MGIAVVGQRSLVAYFGLAACPVTETKSDKSRLEESAEAGHRELWVSKALEDTIPRMIRAKRCGDQPAYAACFNETTGRWRHPSW